MEIFSYVKGLVQQLDKATALLPKGVVPYFVLIWLFSIIPHFRTVFPFVYEP